MDYATKMIYCILLSGPLQLVVFCDPPTGLCLIVLLKIKFWLLLLRQWNGHFRAWLVFLCTLRTYCRNKHS